MKRKKRLHLQTLREKDSFQFRNEIFTLRKIKNMSGGFREGKTVKIHSGFESVFRPIFFEVNF